MGWFIPVLAMIAVGIFVSRRQEALTAENLPPSDPFEWRRSARSQSLEIRLRLTHRFSDRNLRIRVGEDGLDRWWQITLDAPPDFLDLEGLTSTRTPEQTPPHLPVHDRRPPAFDSTLLPGFDGHWYRGLDWTAFAIHDQRLVFRTTDCAEEVLIRRIESSLQFETAIRAWRDGLIAALETGTTPLPHDYRAHCSGYALGLRMLTAGHPTGARVARGILQGALESSQAAVRFEAARQLASKASDKILTRLVFSHLHVAEKALSGHALDLMVRRGGIASVGEEALAHPLAHIEVRQLVRIARALRDGKQPVAAAHISEEILGRETFSATAAKVAFAHVAHVDPARAATLALTLLRDDRHVKKAEIVFEAIEEIAPEHAEALALTLLREDRLTDVAVDSLQRVGNDTDVLAALHAALAADDVTRKEKKALKNAIERVRLRLPEAGNPEVAGGLSVSTSEIDGALSLGDEA